MKCTPMKLYSRKEQSRWQFEKCFQKRNDETPKYFTQKHYGYSISFIRKLFEDQQTSPKLAVNTINLPENVTSYNTGSSLEKWAKKRPRLKSGQRKGLRETLEVLDENAYDISEILESLEHSDTAKEDNISEVNSDIEALWKKSQSGGESSMRERCKIVEGKHERCKKRKHKSKKCIRFCLSKPASPQTEQIIRVEISSTIAISDLNQIQQARNEYSGDQVNLKKDDQKRDMEGDEQDFVIRCSQLAIESKDR